MNTSEPKRLQRAIRVARRQRARERLRREILPWTLALLGCLGVALLIVHFLDAAG